MDSHADSIGDRVIYSDELNSHASQLDSLSWSHNIQLNIRKHTVLFELAYMVLMTVGKNDTPELVKILFNIAVIGQNNIHSEKFAVRKSHSAVNDKHIICTFYNGAVLSDLVQTSERYNLYGRFSGRFSQLS